jgi:hypothetical protein
MNNPSPQPGPRPSGVLRNLTKLLIALARRHRQPEDPARGPAQQTREKRNSKK